MKYHVKIRGVQGEPGKSALFYSVFEVDAPDAEEAARLGLIKGRQRFFGTRDVTVMSATPIGQEAVEVPQLRRMVVQDGKLKRVPT